MKARPLDGRTSRQRPLGPPRPRGAAPRPPGPRSRPVAPPVADVVDDLVRYQVADRPPLGDPPPHPRRRDPDLGHPDHLVATGCEPLERRLDLVENGPRAGRDPEAGE